MAFCTKCGTRLAEGTKFCTLCGAVISNGRTDKPGERSSEPFKDVRTQPDHPPAPPRVNSGNNHAARNMPPNGAGTGNTFNPPVKETRYEPLSVGAFIGITFLMMIPVVNLILLIVWACGGAKNPNTRNYARASLIMMVVYIVLFIILGMFIVSYISRFGMDLLNGLLPLLS